MLLGRRIDAGRLPWRRHRPVAVDSDHGVWARLATGVMRRPVVVMVVVVGALLLVASPFLGVKWGSVDYRVLPPDNSAHVADGLAERGLRAGAVDREPAARDRPTRPRCRRTSTRSKQVDGVLDVRPVDAQDGVTLLRASWAGNSQTQASQDVVVAIRDVPGPGGDGRAGRWPHRGHGRPAHLAGEHTCRGWRRSSPW